MISKTEGLTNPEIATHMGISIKAVEAQITKAYSTLRKNCIAKHHTIVFFSIRISVKVKGLIFSQELSPLL